MNEMKVVEEKFNALTDAQKWEVLRYCTDLKWATSIEKHHKERDACWKWFLGTNIMETSHDEFIAKISEVCNSNSELTFVNATDEFFNYIHKYCKDWRGTDMADSYLTYYTQKRYTTRVLSSKTETHRLILNLEPSRAILTESIYKF